MRLEPAEPSTSSGRPSESTTVGAIIEGSRRPGGWVKKPSGERSCSPIMLLTWMPVPGTTMPEPSPLVHVTAHAQPASSITEMCVVEPSRLAMKRLEEAGLGEPVEERRRALGLRALHRPRERPPRPGARVPALEQRERVGQQRAAGARRRVGEHLAPAVGDAHRLARDRLVGGEVRAA